MPTNTQTATGSIDEIEQRDRFHIVRAAGLSVFVWDANLKQAIRGGAIKAGDYVTITYKPGDYPRAVDIVPVARNGHSAGQQQTLNEALALEAKITAENRDYRIARAVALKAAVDACPKCEFNDDTTEYTRRVGAVAAEFLVWLIRDLDAETEK